MKTSLGGHQSDTVSFTLTMDKVGVYTADINGLSAGFTVKEPPPEGTVAGATEPAEPANFVISGLSISPEEVRPDEEVNISATVSNTGGSSGRYIVVFRVDNKERARKEIALGAGQSQVVSFTISESMIGNYIIDVNGQAGDFMVKLAPPPPTTGTTLPEKPSFNWKPMVIIFAGMIIIVVVLVILYRRIHE
jgi:hypothetical protein